MRVRLFVWFSVSDFLLVVHYVDYKLETDSSSGGSSTPGSPSGVCGIATVLLGQGLPPLVLGSSRIPPPVLIYDWFPLRSLRDCYSSSRTRSSSSGSRNVSDEASSVERHLVGLLPPASGS